MEKSEKENVVKSENVKSEKAKNTKNAKNAKSEKALKTALVKALHDEKARENMGEYFYYIGKSSTTLNLRASAIEKIAFLYDIEKKNIPNAINENKSPVLYGAITRVLKANSEQFYRLRDKNYRD